MLVSKHRLDKIVLTVCQNKTKVNESLFSLKTGCAGDRRGQRTDYKPNLL